MANEPDNYVHTNTGHSRFLFHELEQWIGINVASILIRFSDNTPVYNLYLGIKDECDMDRFRQVNFERVGDLTSMLEDFVELGYRELYLIRLVNPKNNRFVYPFFITDTEYKRTNPP